MFYFAPHSEDIDVRSGTAHGVPHTLSLGSGQRKVACFLAQPLYPEYGLNRRQSWPRRLCGFFEDEINLFPARNG
jgi:hypothetical protein